MSTQEIYNYRKASDQVITGGQPSEDNLQAAASEGFRAVINLATIDPRYSLDDEASSVQALGMAYHHIPVDWDNPTASDFAAFEQVMQALPAEKTLIHCAANFRVTAFYSLYAQKHLGWSAAQPSSFDPRSGRAAITQCGRRLSAICSAISADRTDRKRIERNIWIAWAWRCDIIVYIVDRDEVGPWLRQ